VTTPGLRGLPVGSRVRDPGSPAPRSALTARYRVTALHPATNLFAPAWSLLILLAWPAVVLLAAALLLTRRDA